MQQKVPSANKLAKKFTGTDDKHTQQPLCWNECRGQK